MKRITVVAVLALGYAACQKPGEEGEEVCLSAQAHREECGLGDGEAAPMECTEREECRAACVNEASCDELQDPEPDGDYIECLLDCEKKAEAGTRPCEEALERFESCGIDTTGVDPNQCSGQDLCVANCVNDATCAEILMEDPEGQYNDCLGAC
jgi:hypothetical protein